MPESVCLSMILGNALGRSLSLSSNSSWCICFTDPCGSRKPSGNKRNIVLVGKYMNKKSMKKYKIAVLDDYQNAALESADWSVLRDRADFAVFQDHLADPDAVIERLLPFDVVCVMRERTPLPRYVIERLPNLKLIASTGSGNAPIDLAAAADHGIPVVHTVYKADPTIEFTWALILASARHIVTESDSVRSGGWQQTVGTDLRGQTLGVLGLGRIGSQVARIGSAFGMNLIAWSQNMTPEAAKAAGAILVS